MLRGYDATETLLSCQGNGESATGSIPPVAVVRVACGYIDKANKQLEQISIDCSALGISDRLSCEVVKGAWKFFGPKAIRGGTAMYQDLHCAEIEACQ